MARPTLVWHLLSLLGACHLVHGMIEATSHASHTPTRTTPTTPPLVPVMGDDLFTKYARRWIAASSGPPPVVPTMAMHATTILSVATASPSASASAATSTASSASMQSPPTERIVHTARGSGTSRHPRPSTLHGERGGRDEVRASASSSADSGGGSGASSLSSGAISGAVVGGLVFAFVVIGVTVTYRRHRRRKVKERFNAELWGSAGASSSMAINQPRDDRHSGDDYAANNLDRLRKSVSSRSGFRGALSNGQQQQQQQQQAASSSTILLGHRHRHRHQLRPTSQPTSHRTRTIRRSRSASRMAIVVMAPTSSRSPLATGAASRLWTCSTSI
ncbi:hypothetical protein SYNPS1DRAFT_26323 [Syncephalis pseudoplumigaleata]|uniref:Mid2 domain-containing protein n=1 Tax=Syncephalis pseudoplumigaleata TaxID=1712513 RepID=A0A4V1J2C6_9FUNG|nr:hypothetical protein SYNPS1DRAFT_26323 [Syncephalis pseudoplumigaleata]|eukprot:RKP28089.1 hypothetical protein SYNPS1DRAFT_26323 [Syncephalis pseudoplumigaleata]